ncbi:MAG: tripartite tricarboxylate transporter substrate binding protein [Desulfobacteraceae bacterium]|nr:tripartite tricarboxylate transporter substrate binding protein [Desulfobacteraceae bacterium]
MGRKHFGIFKAVAVMLAAALVLIAAGNVSAAENEFPDQPISIIVPFTVGGGTDGWQRTFAAALSSKDYLGVSVSVRNLPGGQDLRGIGECYRSKPNGYTLTAFNPPSSPFAWYLHRPSWDIREMTGITVYAQDPQMLVASAKYEHKDLESLLNALKNGEQPKVALSGIGGIEHVAAELFAKRYDVELEKYIPYNATSDVISALVRNECDIAFGSFTAVSPAVKEGNLVGIAVAGQKERIGILPEVPTFSEFGDPLLELKFSRAVYGPPDLPEERQQILEKAFIKAQKENELLQARYETYGIKPALGTGEQAEENLKSALNLAEELKIERLTE